MVFQHELGEQKEGHHIQGYIHFSVPKGAAPAGDILLVIPETMSTCNGTASDNRAYCSDEQKRKPGTSPFTYGDCPAGQGERNDLKRAWDKVRETEDLSAALANEDTQIATLKFHKHLEWGLNLVKKQRLRAARRDMWVVVYWGTPGSGKSEQALLFDEENCFTMPPPANMNTLWFGSYAGEKTLIIDEFEKESTAGGVTLSLYWMKRLLDNKPLEVPTKGGHVWAEWENLIITSNYAPDTWYNDADDSWQYSMTKQDGTKAVWGADYPSALQRRITFSNEFKGLWPHATYSPEDPLTLAQLQAQEQEQQEPEPVPLTSDDAEFWSKEQEEDDKFLSDLHQDWEATDNDFMPSSFQPTNTDHEGILDGTDGDTDPVPGIDLLWADIS